MVAAVGSWGCLLLFVNLHPMWGRDGLWLGLLMRAFPWFLLTPSLGLYAMIVPGAGRARVIAALCLVLFASLPITWEFAVGAFTQLIPIFARAA